MESNVKKKCIRLQLGAKAIKHIQDMRCFDSLMDLRYQYMYIPKEKWPEVVQVALDRLH
jgi:hypothetical protein